MYILFARHCNYCTFITMNFWDNICACLPKCVHANPCREVTLALCNNQDSYPQVLYLIWWSVCCERDTKSLDWEKVIKQNSAQLSSYKRSLTIQQTADVIRYVIVYYMYMSCCFHRYASYTESFHIIQFLCSKHIPDKVHMLQYIIICLWMCCFSLFIICCTKTSISL